MSDVWLVNKHGRVVQVPGKIAERVYRGDKFREPSKREIQEHQHAEKHKKSYKTKF